MKTFKAGNIEVLFEDLTEHKEMNWFDSLAAMKALGEGWRFPTLQEMKYIDEITSMGVGNIWLSTYWVKDHKSNRINPDYSIVLEIHERGNNEGILNKDAEASLRPVRDIK